MGTSGADRDAGKALLAKGQVDLSLLDQAVDEAVTGFLMTTDTFWGVEWVENTHEAAVYLTGATIALHVAGVVFASIEHGENLAKSMLTGRKRV